MKHEIKKHLFDINEAADDIENFTDYRSIIAHGYDTIECNLVWSAIKTHLPILKQEVRHCMDAGSIA